MAGFAIRSRFAGHPSCSAKTRNALRLKPDHPIGAGHYFFFYLISHFLHILAVSDIAYHREEHIMPASFSGNV